MVALPPVTCNSDAADGGTISPSLQPSYNLRQGYGQKNGDKKEMSPSVSAGLDQHHSKSFENHYLTNCRLTQVTEAIIKECQGKRKCSLMADKKSLSYTQSGLSPLMTNCQESSAGKNSRARSGSLSNQLKVQYTCASKHIFRNLPGKQLPSTKENDLESTNDITDDTNMINTANLTSAIDKIVISKGKNDGQEKHDTYEGSSEEEQLDPQASSMPGVSFDTSDQIWKSVESAIPTPVVVPSNYPSSSPSYRNEERKRTEVREAVTTQSSNCTVILEESKRREAIGFSGDWISAYIFISRRFTL